MTDIPPKPPKQEMQNFSVYMPKKLVKSIDVLCRQLNYSRSEFFLRIVESYMAEREKKQAQTSVSDAAAH